MLLTRTARLDSIALVSVFGAAIAAVVVFFPAEGRVLVPAHAAIEFLLGHASFVLPLGLALSAGLGFVIRARPAAALPTNRLLGLGLITIAFLPADALLGQSTGLVGDWFTEFLVGVLGRPLTVALTTAVLVMGVALTFNLTRLRVAAR